MLSAGPNASRMCAKPINRVKGRSEMNANPWDGTGQARRALQGIVRDPQYGVAALSQPAVMSNLLKDFLPDEPREAGLLVAAAQADLAGSLRGYLAQGLDPATAVSLTASAFVSSSSHTQEAGQWVVTELALALGVDPSRTAQAAAPLPTQLAQPTAPTAVDPLINQATPPYQQATPPYQQPAQPFQQAAPPYQQVAQPYQQATPPYQVASPWQQQAVAAPPRPASRGSAGPAVIGLGGALLTLIACFVPTSTFSGSPSFGVFFGHVGFGVSFDFWFAAVPLVTLIAGTAAAIGLLVPGDRPRGRAMSQGLLVVIGVQTVVLFGFYGYGLFQVGHHGAGGPIGILGGLAFLIGGIVAIASGGNSGTAPAGAPGTVSPGTVSPGTVSPGTVSPGAPGGVGGTSG